LIARKLVEAVYPLLSKKACSMLQKLGKSKNCIVIPLKIENEIVGGMFLTTTQEEISQHKKKYPDKN